jgi:hypothetical protein
MLSYNKQLILLTSNIIMGNLQEEINLKRKLVEATDAVRKKYKTLKARVSENKSELEEIYRPVTTRLESIKGAVTDFTKLPLKPHAIKTPLMQQSTKPGSSKKTGPKSREMDDTMKLMDPDLLPPTPAQSMFEEEFITPTAESEAVAAIKPKKLTFSSESKKPKHIVLEYIEKLKRSTAGFDTTYGVYQNTDGKFYMGNSEVHFPPGQISLKRGNTALGKYPVSDQLLDLIFLKQPKALQHLNKISEDTLKIYYNLLTTSNAIFHSFNPTLAFKTSNSHKYTKIIKPLIRSQKTGGNLTLLNNKVLNSRKIDYVYWNKPKELINRLRLLWGSKQAGNTGVDNEIISIIEELREEGIIY